MLWIWINKGLKKWTKPSKSAKHKIKYKLPNLVWNIKLIWTKKILISVGEILEKGHDSDLRFYVIYSCHSWVQELIYLFIYLFDCFLPQGVATVSKLVIVLCPMPLSETIWAPNLQPQDYKTLAQSYSSPEELNKWLALKYTMFWTGYKLLQTRFRPERTVCYSREEVNK